MRFAKGERAALPLRFLHHLVAARYGCSPADVRERWAVDDFLYAVRIDGYLERGA